MASAVNINDVIEGHVALEVECVDRLLLNAYVPNLQVGGQVARFITGHLGRPIASAAVLASIGNRFRRDVRRFADAHAIPVLKLKTPDRSRWDDRKLDHVRPYLDTAERERRFGPVAIVAGQEFQWVFSARTDRRGKALWLEFFREQRRVGVYYFYILDPDFGPAFITIATYFPYPARVWVNGHEWAKRQAQHAGIAYRALSNGFASTPEPERLQAICDGLQPGHIQAFFDISNADLRRPFHPPSNRTARPRADGDGGWVKSTYEPYTQFYSAAISPQDVSRVSGGTQDNGSLRSWGGPDWNEYVGGDGEENLINPRNSQNVFACYQYGNCFRSVDGGDTNQYFADRVVGDRANWFTPVQFDPSDPDVMYYGSNVLNRSTDNGLTWTAISPDVTGGPGQDAYPFGTITTVAAAQSDSRTIYFGTDDGRIWVTRDLGASWTLAYSGTAWITRVAVDPVDAATVYATRSGYRSGSYQPHVLVSHDSGGSWTDLSGNLPQAPVNDVVLGRGRTVYVATDQGVFVSRSGLDRWQRMGRGLPLVPVDDIEYDAGHRRLVAATFGRSMYEIDAP